ncbi:MAG: hypothetical protein ACRCX2_09080 [Paraclostridium sp.]
MRDTYLGLNQKNVLILKNKYVDKKGESLIKTEDLILIRRIQDFIASSKTIQVIVGKEIYSWVKYDVIQDDLPMIFPSVKSLKKRIERLSDIGLIINKAYAVSKSMILDSESEDGFENAGTYSVIKLSKECRTMFDFSNMVNPIENTDFVEGFPLEGGKGQPLEGGKGQPLEGGNKEYQEKNTIKRIPRTCKEELVPFENFFKENMGINFTATNQKHVLSLLKKLKTEEAVKSFLYDNYKMAVANKEKDPSVKTVEGLFCHYLKKEERIPEFVEKESKKEDKATTTTTTTETKKEIIVEKPVVKETEQETKEIVITKELEDMAIEILVNDMGLTINHINDTKKKSSFRYNAMLKQALREKDVLKEVC